ncbi:MAG: 4Fe-4S cluster-binding domain-containing protein [Nitrospira sp.]|jgi:anaerobic ribonucleoside-triphosphate reductase activating protein|nr:4Fe-4S cluster-binding domain-containing protein [Nitrospira sp.]
MNILVNKAHYPVSVLGHGKRVGIWMQGCSIRCRSCCSLDTWEFEADRGMEVAMLVDWCRDVSGGFPDGVTISGGEPFDQPKALLALLKAFDGWRSESRSHFDILLYSGYSEARLRRECAEHLNYLDALVAGPFQERSGGEKPFCGSDNQQMITLSPLAETRYGAAGLSGWKSGMQAAADDEGIWMIGIPRPGDLGRFEAGCAERGLALGKPSWRC